MRAVVLVGGLGTRLRPLTDTIPKQMLPIVNRPMIERVLEHLAGYGVDQAVLALGFKPDAFRDAYPDGSCGGVQVHYAIESEPLDTAGAVRFAVNEAGFDDDRVVVVNGDVLTDLDLGALVAFHERSNAEATIALHRVDDPSRYGVVPTDEHGRVLAFVEKPTGEAPTNLINAGTYVLEPSAVARIELGRRVSIERETFPALVADATLYALDGDAYWIDAGTPETYLQAQLDLLDGVRGAPEPGIGDGASVAESARVTRSAIGRGVTVHDGAVVESSVVMTGSVVGPGAVVRSSIVGRGAVMGADVCIDQLSVIGDGEIIDDGTAYHAAKV
jgi:mannose-1-phosphate guanylyltransferase